MNQTKISRIETGRTLPTVIDVERILKALDVPGKVSDEILRLTRRANVDYASWRTYARVGFYHKQAELKALESSSRVMRHFLPAIPTGLPHVRDYATATLTPTVEGTPPGTSPGLSTLAWSVSGSWMTIPGCSPS